MKLKLLSVFLLLSNLSLTAQEFKTPVDYLTFINNEQLQISKSTWKYTQAVAHSKSARRIDATRKQLIKSIEVSSKKIENLTNGYKGDVEYRDQTVHFFDIRKKSLNEEYEKLIDMQEVAEQSYDAMEAYLLTRDLVNKKLDAENENMEKAFNAFALKYNITINNEESDLSKKMQLSNEVFDYHTVLYLIFFKVNFTDNNLSKAIEAKDLGKIQQNASSLLLFANEGLEKIKTIAPFQKDASLLNATKDALEYYKKEAEQFVPNVVSFLMFNDKFENAKNTLEDKSAKDRTKEEIDNYNVMVKQYNKEVDNFNKANNANFQEKNKNINSINTIGDNFISRHIPND
jgi:hypothetical protein